MGKKWGLWYRRVSGQVKDYPGAVVGRVLRVYDGDTLAIRTVNGVVVVRLAYMDAPEHGQGGFSEARAALRAAVWGREISARVLGVDRYGRAVAVVSTATAADVGLQLVAAGLAWWYRQTGGAHLGYRDAELVARRRGIGLWSVAGAIPPWCFRVRVNKRPKGGA